MHICLCELRRSILDAQTQQCLPAPCTTWLRILLSLSGTGCTDMATAFSIPKASSAHLSSGTPTSCGGMACSLKFLSEAGKSFLLFLVGLSSSSQESPCCTICSGDAAVAFTSSSPCCAQWAEGKPMIEKGLRSFAGASTLSEAYSGRSFSSKLQSDDKCMSLRCSKAC